MFFGYLISVEVELKKAKGPSSSSIPMWFLSIYFISEFLFNFDTKVFLSNQKQFEIFEIFWGISL